MVDELKELLNRYVELARIHARIDYGDLRSVKQANNAVAEMISISRNVSLMGESGWMVLVLPGSGEFKRRPSPY